MAALGFPGGCTFDSSTEQKAKQTNALFPNAHANQPIQQVMKTAHVVTLLAISTILGLSACSKKSDDVTPATPAQTAAGVQVKVDGKLFAPDLNYALAAFPGRDYYYGIYGLDSKTSDVVVIALPYTVGEGTFPLNNVNIGMLSTARTSFSTVVSGGTGTVTITKKTATNVVGTFSFTAYDDSGTQKSVLTEGSFNVAVKY